MVQRHQGVVVQDERRRWLMPVRAMCLLTSFGLLSAAFGEEPSPGGGTKAASSGTAESNDGGSSGGQRSVLLADSGIGGFRRAPQAGSSNPTHELRIASLLEASNANSDAASTPSRWHPAIVFDRGIEAKLREACRAIDRGDKDAALTTLQHVLATNTDVFVHTGDDSTPLGARRVASEYIERLDSEYAKRYELLFGSEARHLFRKAQATRNPLIAEQVVRQYFHTVAGAEAAEWLACRDMNRGAYRLAATGFQRLATSNVHRARCRPETVHKLAICLQRAGLKRDAEQLIAEHQRVRSGNSGDPAPGVRSAQSRTSDGSHPSDASRNASPVGYRRSSDGHKNWITRSQLSQTVFQRPTHVVGGSSDRNAAQSATLPILNNARWSVSLATETQTKLSDLVRNWETSQVENGMPVGTTQFAIAVGNNIVFRDFSGIRCVDATTGSGLWSHRTRTSLERDLTANGQSASDSPPDSAQLPRLLVANSTLGMLSGDARRVYAIDELESNWNQQTMVSGGRQVPNPAAVSRTSNRLIALAADFKGSVQEQPLWSVGGPAVTGDGEVRIAEGQEHKTTTQPAATSDQPGMPRRILAGHFFCGPPLPVDGRLFVVTEFEQMLNVACLDAETGSLLWLQPIATPSLPISLDMHRYYLGCPLSHSQGVLVVPTQLGVLVAVDPCDGHLLWATGYEDPESVTPQTSFWPHIPKRRYDHPGYLNVPVIVGQSVVYLPAHSEFVHSFDLTTGLPIWKTPRETSDPERVEFVAAASPTNVMLVTRQSCRGLSLSTGDQLWRRSLPSVPAGRGVKTEGGYILPLVDGRMISIDTNTGRETGWLLSRASQPAGNLLVTSDSIVSVSRDRLTAYPQARSFQSGSSNIPPVNHTALAPFSTLHTAANSMRNADDDTAARVIGWHADDSLTTQPSIEKAEVLAALGDRSAAGVMLQSMCHQSAPDANVAREMLRQLRLSELMAGDTSSGTLDELASLSQSTEQEIQQLILTAEFEFSEGHLPAACQTALTILDIEHRELVALPMEPTVKVQPVSWLNGFLRKMIRSGQHDPNWPLVEQALQSRVDSLVDCNDQRMLRNVDLALAGWPAADGLRLRCAAQNMQKQHWHASEAALLDLKRSGRADTEIAALKMLAELWATAGAEAAAGSIIRDLEARLEQSESSSASGDDGQLASWIRDFLSQRPLASHAVQRLKPSAVLSERMKITESRWRDHRLQQTYNAAGMRLLNSAPIAGVDLFDAGRGAGSQLVAVDRNSGIERRPIKMPPRYYYPDCRNDASVGHLTLIGSPGAAHGLSLLQNGIAWSTLPEGMQASTESVRVGPAGTSFAAFQWRQHLFVVHPGTGELLWHRRDLDSMSGLMDEPALGLFGDERGLVLFSSDRRNYTVYNVSSGEVMQSGRLDADPRQRRLVGKNMLYVSNQQSPELRLWNPFTGSTLWKRSMEEIREVSPLAGRPPGSRVFSMVNQADEFAVITSSGDVQVIDGGTGRLLFDVPVPAGQLPHLRDVRVFRDSQRYYVNLMHMTPPGELTPQISFPTTDATIPVVNVHGYLIAIDRNRGQIAWERTISNRSILSLPEFNLPFLVTLARINTNNQLSLQVEVLNAATGETCLSRDGLQSSRILQMHFDSNPLRLLLRGADTEIELKLRTVEQSKNLSPENEDGFSPLGNLGPIAAVGLK